MDEEHTIVRRASRFKFLTTSFLTPYNTETTYEGVMKEDDVNLTYYSN